MTNRGEFKTDITCPLAYWQEEINVGETETSLTGGVYGVNTPIPEEIQKSQYYNVLLDLIEFIKAESSGKHSVGLGATTKPGSYEGPTKIDNSAGFVNLSYDDIYIYAPGAYYSNGDFKTFSYQYDLDKIPEK